MRPDLRAAFPPGTARGRRAFFRWFLFHAETEGLSSPPFSAPARTSPTGRALLLARRAVDKRRGAH